MRATGSNPTIAPNGRALAIAPEAHAVYRALIDGLLATGALPGEAALATMAVLIRLGAPAARRAARGRLAALGAAAP